MDRPRVLLLCWDPVPPQLAAGYVDRYTRGAALCFMSACEPGAVVARPVVEIADDDDIELAQVGAVQVPLDVAGGDLYDRRVSINGAGLAVVGDQPHEEWSVPAIPFSPSHRQLHKLRDRVSELAWSLAAGLKREGIAQPPFSDRRTSATFGWHDDLDGATLVLDERGATVVDRAGLYGLPWAMIDAVCTFESASWREGVVGVGVAPEHQWWSKVSAAADAAQRWRRDFADVRHSFIGIEVGRRSAPDLVLPGAGEDPAAALSEVVAHYRPDLKVGRYGQPVSPTD